MGLYGYGVIGSLKTYNLINLKLFSLHQIFLKKIWWSEKKELTLHSQTGREADPNIKNPWCGSSVG